MADNKFLDQAGLQILWDAIKAKFATIVDLTELESDLQTLQTLVDTKAAKDDVDAAVEAINASIDTINNSLGDDYYTKDEIASEISTAVNAAIDALVDGAPEALDTLKELAAMAESQEGVIEQMQEEINTNKAAIEELAQPSVPTYDQARQNVYANGQAIRISEAADGSLDISYRLGLKAATLNVPANTRFFGGGDGSVKNVEYPGTSIVLESGTVKSIYGGGRNNCTVGTASIVVNGGRVTDGVLGGGGGDTAPENGAGNVAEANIVINGGNIFMVYGGGQNMTNVGSVTIDIFDGTIGYLTTGGSNGSTGSGKVSVYGGTIDVWQAVNRGTLENSVMTLNGGVVNKMYCVGETEDASVTGHVGYSTVSIQHGAVTTLRLGNTTKEGKATSGTVKGEYREGIVTNDPDEVLVTFNKIADTELEAMTSEEILAICK